MSGRPSWALYEPSANSTSECTTLWGWITASILEYGKPIQPSSLHDLECLVHQGRRVDRDLRAHPPGRMRERLLGGDRCELSDASRPRNGPPLAVRTRRATSPMRSPTRHCQIAECSLSTGRRRSSGSPPSSSSAAATRCPPVTSVSLFASATRFPARSAASTAGSAAMPGRRDDHELDSIGGRQLLEPAGRPTRGGDVRPGARREPRPAPAATRRAARRTDRRRDRPRGRRR